MKINMAKEKEEDKLSYMTKKPTLINKQISMHEEMCKSNENS